MNSMGLPTICARVAEALADLNVFVAPGAWSLASGEERVPVVIVYCVPDEKLLLARRRAMDLFAELFPEDEPWPILTVHTASDCAAGGACHDEFRAVRERIGFEAAMLSTSFVLAWVGNDPLDRYLSAAALASFSVLVQSSALKSAMPVNPCASSSIAPHDYGVAA
ncbi:MAG: hypothetical protein IT457_19830 [Planctomycetes bacterium]|nr:hypothetical protein [Planctomycetota bacterium]